MMLSALLGDLVCQVMDGDRLTTLKEAKVINYNYNYIRVTNILAGSFYSLSTALL